MKIIGFGYRKDSRWEIMKVTNTRVYGIVVCIGKYRVYLSGRVK